MTTITDPAIPATARGNRPAELHVYPSPDRAIVYLELQDPATRHSESVWLDRRAAVRLGQRLIELAIGDCDSSYANGDRR